MAILNRLSHLFTADLHALLDRIEEPEALLKQALRDMDEVIKNAEIVSANLGRRNKNLQLQVARVERTLVQCAEHLDSAFRADNEHLAKQLIRQRLEHERQAIRLNDQLAQNAQEQRQTQQQLDENHATIASIRLKLESLETSPQTPDPEFGELSAVTDQDVEAVFLAEQRRRVTS
ncbi:MAG: PspA/IM30 family protein [Lysobacterales bacterium]